MTNKEFPNPDEMAKLIDEQEKSENEKTFVKRLLQLVSDLSNATDNDQREHHKAEAKIEDWVTNYFESGSVKIELEVCEICGAEIPDSEDWCQEC